MRYLRIFLLHTQEMLQDRGRLLVWFLLGCISPLILVLFWRGANPIAGWSFSQIASYYFLVVILGAFLMAHHEDMIARIDIQEGGLTAHLLKPFSYFWLKFFSEIPFRLIQGVFGMTTLIIFIQFFPTFFSFTTSSVIILLSLCVSIAAFFLAFFYKTLFALLAFWMTDARGAFETAEVLLVVFAGYLMPIPFFPDWVQSFIYFLPFPYMIYFPIVAFEGKLSTGELLHVLMIQGIWLLIFFFLYQKMWSAGIKKYTGVGQ